MLECNCLEIKLAVVKFKKIVYNYLLYYLLCDICSLHADHCDVDIQNVSHVIMLDARM